MQTFRFISSHFFIFVIVLVSSTGISRNQERFSIHTQSFRNTSSPEFGTAETKWKTPKTQKAFSINFLPQI
jgi:hypothetical protein